MRALGEAKCHWTGTIEAVCLPHAQHVPAQQFCSSAAGAHLSPHQSVRPWHACALAQQTHASHVMHPFRRARWKALTKKQASQACAAAPQFRPTCSSHASGGQRRQRIHSRLHEHGHTDIQHFGADHQAQSQGHTPAELGVVCARACVGLRVLHKVAYVRTLMRACV